MWAMENLKINALFWSRRNKIWSALVCAENKWDESRAEGKQLLTTGGTTHCVRHKYSSSLPLTWPVQEETTSCHRPSGPIHLHWSFHDVQTWFWVPFCSLFVFLETISQRIRLSVWIKIYSAVKTNTAVSISHKQSLWILTVNKYISGCSSTVGNGCSFEGVHSTKETPVFVLCGTTHCKHWRHWPRDKLHWTRMLWVCSVMYVSPLRDIWVSWYAETQVCTIKLRETSRNDQWMLRFNTKLGKYLCN